jgi:hypothetical protein
LNPEVLAVNANGFNPRQIFCLPDASCACNLTHPPPQASVVWASDLISDDASAAEDPMHNSVGKALMHVADVHSVSFVALFNLGNEPMIPSVLGSRRSMVRVHLDQIRPAWGVRFYVMINFPFFSFFLF